jgi:large subunit ribosomal protein L21
MYAVIRTGGKQYKVVPNQKFEVEKLEGKAGDKVVLADVLLAHDLSGVKIGAPTVEGVKVNAEILEQKKGEKVIIFKKKRRHNYRRKNGHRQELTLLQVTGIDGLKGELPVKAKPEKAEKKVEAKTSVAKKKAPKAAASKAKEENTSD